MVGWKTAGSRHCYSECSDFAPYSVTIAGMEAMNLLLLMVSAVAAAAAAANADYLLMMAMVVTWLEYVALELVAVAVSTTQNKLFGF